MSKQTKTGEINFLVNDIKNMNADEADRAYGIKVDTDGSVYDPTYDQSFKDVREWASFTVEQDYDDFSDHGGSGFYDEEVFF